MALLLKQMRFRFLEFIPLILLFFISLNVHYILIYFWVLRQPQVLGYGFIFLSGIIADVVFGLPIGATALSLLVVSGVAAYVRVVTVRISLITDWISFIPALLFGNLIYFLALYFSDFSIDYLYLFRNSIFTFIFYPVLWALFSLLLRLIKT